MRARRIVRFGESNLDTPLPIVLTPEEAASSLAVAPGTVRIWLRKGILPGFRVEGQWRIRADELAEWLEERRNVAPTPKKLGPEPLIDEP